MILRLRAISLLDRPRPASATQSRGRGLSRGLGPGAASPPPARRRACWKPKMPMSWTAPSNGLRQGPLSCRQTYISQQSPRHQQGTVMPSSRPLTAAAAGADAVRDVRCGWSFSDVLRTARPFDRRLKRQDKSQSPAPAHRGVARSRARTGASVRLHQRRSADVPARNSRCGRRDHFPKI